jgi:hypothetical protein
MTNHKDLYYYLIAPLTVVLFFIGLTSGLYYKSFTIVITVVNVIKLFTSVSYEFS